MQAYVPVTWSVTGISSACREARTVKAPAPNPAISSPVVGHGPPVSDKADTRLEKGRNVRRIAPQNQKP